MERGDEPGMGKKQRLHYTVVDLARKWAPVKRCAHGIEKIEGPMKFEPIQVDVIVGNRRTEVGASASRHEQEQRTRAQCQPDELAPPGPRTKRWRGPGLDVSSGALPEPLLTGSRRTGPRSAECLLPFAALLPMAAEFLPCLNALEFGREDPRSIRPACLDSIASRRRSKVRRASAWQNLSPPPAPRGEDSFLPTSAVRAKY